MSSTACLLCLMKEENYGIFEGYLCLNNSELKLKKISSAIGSLIAGLSDREKRNEVRKMINYLII